MNRRVRLLPYGPSNSARALAQRLNVRRLRTPGSRFRARDGDTIINWGHNGCAPHGGLPGTWWMGTVRWINHPSKLGNARDKLACFQKLTAASVPTVEWTIDKARAIGWITGGTDVFVRATTTGQGGAGISVCPHDGPDPHVLPDAPLYTRYFRARHEYRAHVIGDKVWVSKKRRRNGAEPNAVRNHANGYVYCTENVDPHDNVIEVALDAVRALQLDFGAVDILCTDRGDARVLEVNTAPGLEGRTLDFYATNLGAML